MAKRKLIEEALIDAKDLEDASVENAKNIVVEQFKPEFVELFKDVLNESSELDEDEELDEEEIYEDEELDEEELYEDEELDEEELYEDEELDEEELYEDELDETDHDIGKQEEDDGEYESEHDLGKGFQSEAVYVDEDGYLLDENGEYLYEDDIEEGKYYAGSGDPTPEKGQAGLPTKPKVKQTKNGWEDNGTAGYAAEDPEKGNYNGLDGVPTPEKGWGPKGPGTIKRAEDPEKGNYNGLDGVPKPSMGWGPKNELAEAPLSDIIRELNARGILEDEDIDIEDLVESSDEDYSDEVYEIDEEIDFDLEDDDPEPYQYRLMRSGVVESKGSDDDDELDVPEKLFDDDDDESEDKDLDEEEEIYESDDEEDDSEEEEVDENLYVRHRDGFMKVSLDEYLDTRIETLQEEYNELIDIINSLEEELLQSQGELQESYLYNSKLAYMNKLFVTGSFTNSEKTRIIESLDNCESVSEVEGLYNSIISEVQEANPLDGFSKLLKEQISTGGESRTKNIYESSDLSRMRKLIEYGK